ncbi:MAG: saccharopine dehydrogenase NADP-binding domain-containing protein [Aeromicrobium sp.]
MPSSAPARELDLVLYGVTGFVGALLAKYVATAAPAGARIGLAGRDTARVEKVRTDLGDAAASWSILRADATDPTSLRDMAERAQVVVTTVGPYAAYGLPVVEACVEAGTDYADLTGEALFVRSSIDGFHDRALEAGSRIVHSCGFDSIPSDLGVYLTYLRALEDGEGELESSTLVCTFKGGLSGGTIASGRGQMRAIAEDKSLAKVVSDPYVLSTDRALETDLGQQSDTALSRASAIDSSLTGWITTFLMAPYNTRVVRRSNALLGWAYGKQFRYREVLRVPGRMAPVAAVGMAAAMWAQSKLGPFAHRGFGPRVIDRIVPAPGTGPSAEARDAGFFTTKTFTTTSTGARYLATVTADGDPGYKATAVMLGEAGLCLAFDREKLSTLRGVLTPAPVMAEPLAERLRNAGLTIEIERVST